MPIYGAPYEAASPGCTGAAGAVCCGGQEFALRRDAVQHTVFKMWLDRPTGTAPRDGTAPQNFRGMGLRLGVRSGAYAADAAWSNAFFQADARAGDGPLRASLELGLSGDGGSFQDPMLALTNSYLLLVPSDDPSAPGFVVKSAAYPEAVPALDPTAWAACRAAACSAAAGACAPQDGPAPYASQRGVTSASVVAASWAALGRPVGKTCQVLGNGRQATHAANLSPGPTYASQYISCDYQGTYLMAVATLPRAAVDAGNAPRQPPPSPSPPSPASSPVMPMTSSPESSPATQVASPVSSPAAPVANAPAPQSSPPPRSSPPPPPKSASLQGTAVAFVATLPAYTSNTFEEVSYAASIQKAVVGATAKPAVRIRAVAGVAGGAAARRLLQGGVLVDTVVNFAPEDTTPALVLLNALKTKPASVFPASQVGRIPYRRRRPPCVPCRLFERVCMARADGHMLTWISL